jgi:hypothetical protein
LVQVARVRDDGLDPNLWNRYGNGARVGSTTSTVGARGQGGPGSLRPGPSTLIGRLAELSQSKRILRSRQVLASFGDGPAPTAIARCLQGSEWSILTDITLVSSSASSPSFLHTCGVLRAPQWSFLLPHQPRVSLRVKASQLPWGPAWFASRKVIGWKTSKEDSLIGTVERSGSRSIGRESTSSRLPDLFPATSSQLGSHHPRTSSDDRKPRHQSLENHRETTAEDSNATAKTRTASPLAWTAGSPWWTSFELLLGSTPRRWRY